MNWVPSISSGSPSNPLGAEIIYTCHVVDSTHCEFPNSSLIKYGEKEGRCFLILRPWVHVLVARKMESSLKNVYNHVSGYDPIVLSEVNNQKTEFWYHSQRMNGLTDAKIIPTYDLSPLVDMWRKELKVDKVKIRCFNSPISCIHCGIMRTADRSEYGQRNRWVQESEVDQSEHFIHLTDGYQMCQIKAIYENGREETLTHKTIPSHPDDFPKDDSGMKIISLLEVCHDCKYRKVRSLRSSTRRRYSIWSKPMEWVNQEYIDKMPQEWWRCRSAFSQEFAKRLSTDDSLAIGKSIKRQIRRHPTRATSNLLKMLASGFKIEKSRLPIQP
jgi:hypothetical protein